MIQPCDRAAVQLKVVPDDEAAAWCAPISGWPISVLLHACVLPCSWEAGKAVFDKYLIDADW